MSITNDGFAIRVVRNFRGYSRAELARLSKLPPRRLSAIEFGMPARPEELAAIWGALTTDPPIPSSAGPARRRVHAGVQDGGAGR